MYQFKALGDLHPTNIVINSVQHSLPNALERFLVFTALRGALYAQPQLLANKRFLSTLGSYLVFRGAKNSSLVDQDLRMAADIAAEELKELGNGHAHLYLEGLSSSASGCHPIGIWATRKGIPVTYLDDESNHWYSMLEAEYVKNAYEYKTLQSNREDVWVKEKIVPSPALETSLLFVGGDHIKNRWGLVDKLRSKDIELAPLPELQAIAFHKMCTQELPSD